jgi:hypothetical protein
MVQPPAERHTATLLSDGRVLVTGGSSGVRPDGLSAELFDPSDMTWTAMGGMNEARRGHSATLLGDGMVLVAGGSDGSEEEVVHTSAELFDPATGTWTRTGPMIEGRFGHTATLLPDGRVLVAGGQIGWDPGDELASAELYDPDTGTWATTGRLLDRRSGHTATLLPDGRVLVAAGPANHLTPTAELYDPSSGSWSPTQDMVERRFWPTATLLADGRVLVAGGVRGGTILAAAELFDPVSGSWTATGQMLSPRSWFTATLLADGKVLVTGGGDGGYGGSNRAELYDPMTGSWIPTQDMLRPHGYHAASPLADGRVLVVGGFPTRRNPDAEVYSPHLTPG